MKLEIEKKILKNVSLDKHQFSIELEQLLKKLNRTEKTNFITWVKDEFGVKYPNEISNVLKKNSHLRLGL